MGIYDFFSVHSVTGRITFILFLVLVRWIMWALQTKAPVCLPFSLLSVGLLNIFFLLVFGSHCSKYCHCQDQSAKLCTAMSVRDPLFPLHLLGTSVQVGSKAIIRSEESQSQTWTCTAKVTASLHYSTGIHAKAKVCWKRKGERDRLRDWFREASPFLCMLPRRGLCQKSSSSIETLSLSCG